MSRELAAEGAAVLTVLHDLDVAAAYSDRMVLLRGGEVVAGALSRCVRRSCCRGVSASD